MKLFSSKFLVGLVLSTFVLWTACGGGGGSPMNPPSGGSSSNLSVYLTDSPLDGAQGVWVSINSVSIRNAETGQWLPVVAFSPAREFDILSLQTVRQLVAAVRVPAGSYDMVRVDIAAVRVVRNGESHSASLARNPVELPVALSISEFGAIEVTMDIEASLAIVEDATGIHFDPGRIKVLPPSTTVTVSPGTGSGNIPPPDLGVPSRRPVVVHGKILQILPDNLAFLMEADFGRGVIQPMTHPVPGGHQVLVLTRHDTRYFPEGMGFGDLAVGMKVAAVGVPVKSGERDAIVAFEVYLRHDDPPERSAIRGVILEVLKDLRLVKVGKPWGWSILDVAENGGSAVGHPGQWHPPMEYTWVAITDQTRIMTPEGTALTIEDLQVGQLTEVTGKWRSSDILEAITMIVFQPRPAPTETLGGIIVDINGADFIFTLAVHRAGGPTIPGFPTSGPGGGIGPATSGSGDPPSGGASSPIRLVRVKVTPSTVILGPDGTTLTFEDLKVGMLVEVRGKTERDFFVASKILVRPAFPRVVPFAGVIREKDEENKILILETPLPLNGLDGTELPPLRVKVTEDTDIRDSQGNALTWADLAVGQFIRGGGTLLPEEHLILAHFIKVGYLAPPPLPSFLVGRIVDIRPETLSFVLAVRGNRDDGGGDYFPPGDDGNYPEGVDDPAEPPEFLVEVFTNDGTEFVDADGSAISFEDLAIGDFVECAGEWTPQESAPPQFLAHRVHRIHPPPPPLGVVEGRIVEIFPDAKAFTIERLQPNDDRLERIRILTNDDTSFFGPNGPIGFEDLTVGDLVTVRGEWLPADPTHTPAMMAHEVRKHASSPGVAFVFGLVSRLEIGPERSQFGLQIPCSHPANVLPPGEMAVNVVAERGVQIIDRDENPVPLDRLANGQLVLVYGEWSLLTIFPPIFIAHKIIILDTDNSTSCVDGQVAEIDLEHRVIVLSRNGSDGTDRIRLHIPANAWILLPNGDRVRLEHLRTGDFVSILGDWEEISNEVRLFVADLVLEHPKPSPH